MGKPEEHDVLVFTSPSCEGVIVDIRLEEALFKALSDVADPNVRHSYFTIKRHAENIAAIVTAMALKR